MCVCVCLPISHLVCCERVETCGRSPRGSCFIHSDSLGFYFILYVRIVISFITDMGITLHRPQKPQNLCRLKEHLSSKSHQNLLFTAVITMFRPR